MNRFTLVVVVLLFCAGLLAGDACLGSQALPNDLSPTVQSATGQGGREVLGKWRSDRELGRIGGTFGGILGGFGGLIGILGGIIGGLAGAGKAKGVVMAIMRLTIGFAVLCIVAGFALLAMGEWWVFYAPLFFLGILVLAIVVPLMPMVKRRYDELELRKISAQDA